MYALAGDRRNDPRIVQILLEHGADPNARGNGGLTPITVHRVSDSEYGKTEMARVLIEHGVMQMLGQDSIRHCVREAMLRALFINFRAPCQVHCAT